MPKSEAFYKSECFYETLICLMITVLLGAVIGLSGWIGHERGYREGYQACKYEQNIGQYMHKDIWPGREK